ncbi:hypothetical protein CAL24_18045 [Bordetella genomosp. 2]|uniref:Uncharacterized protein n=1 Tax=Bordetella genomosp. 2 TaxID=1983456 RepID=A0A261VIT8_9BORD|nr:hypothetical protein CAL24_18045 [Bordetella genomosp. 2]
MGRPRLPVGPGRPRRSARARHQAPSAPCGGCPRSNWPPRPHRQARAHSISGRGTRGLMSACQCQGMVSRVGVRHPMHAVSTRKTVHRGV